jgi:hypothetical protein
MEIVMLRVCDKRLIAVAGIASALLWGSAANALPVQIGLQDISGGGAFTAPVPSEVTASGAASFFGAFGTYTFNNITATGIPLVSVGDILQSTSVNVTSALGGTLRVFITETGITGGSPLKFTTGVTVQNGNGFSATATSYIDTVAYGTGTPLSTFLGLVPGATGSSQTSNQTPAGTYSVTEIYNIILAAGATASLTMDVSAAPQGGQTTPLPAALPLLGSVLGGGLLFGRLRNRRKARAQVAAV